MHFKEQFSKSLHSNDQGKKQVFNYPFETGDGKSNVTQSLRDEE